MNTDYKLMPEQSAFSPQYFPKNIPLLRREEVHVWCVSLNLEEMQIQSLMHFLSSDERRRAETFHFDKDRNHFIATRGMLRRIIGMYLQCDPGRLCFSYGPYGKPELAGGNDGSVQFNVSHSNGLVLYGITNGRKIGIDLECIRTNLSFRQIANKYFSSEENTLVSTQSAPLQRDTFFSLWTAKEAYIKAMGGSIFTDQKQLDFSTTTSGEEQTLLKSPEGASWWTSQKLSVGHGYVATVVVEGHYFQLKYYQSRSVIS